MLLYAFIGAVVVLVTASFLTVFAIPAFIAFLAFAGWKIYDIYQKSDAVQERKLREHTQVLYERAKASPRAAPDKVEFGKGLMRHLRTDVPQSVLDAALVAALDMYDVEGWNGEIPPPPPVANSVDGARYRDYISKISALTKRDIEIIHRTIADSFHHILAHAPEEVDGEAFITQPMHMFITGQPKELEQALLPYYNPDARPLFAKLRDRLDTNVRAVGDVLPTEYKGDNIIYDYLRDTPLHQIFKAPIAIAVPRHVRHEHAIITGGSGHGKTTLLENLILRDLNDDENPSIVVVDSQRALIGKVSKLAAVHQRPLILIDPKDAPALNPFAFDRKRYATYGEAERERVRNHTMELFGYLFSSLLGADLTARQGALFNYVIQAMLAMPDTMDRNATLEDVIAITENPDTYQPAIDALQPIARQFFATDFVKGYKDTKEQIRYRLHAILGNTSIARLFLAQENTVDFYEQLNNGASILIDTDKGFLGAKNSGHLGRIAITLLLQAILERDASSAAKREVFMYVDEAGEYFDRSIDNFLTEARKQRAGITLAHQHFGQMTPELRSSVAANASTKYAGGLSAQDARGAAQDMRTTPDFLLAQERLTFATYIRNVTKTATSVTARIGQLAEERQVSDEDYAAFRARNRERLASTHITEKKERMAADAHDGAWRA